MNSMELIHMNKSWEHEHSISAEENRLLEEALAELRGGAGE